MPYIGVMATLYGYSEFHVPDGLTLAEAEASALAQAENSCLDNWEVTSPANNPNYTISEIDKGAFDGQGREEPRNSAPQG